VQSIKPFPDEKFSARREIFVDGKIFSPPQDFLSTEIFQPAARFFFVDGNFSARREIFFVDGKIFSPPRDFFVDGKIFSPPRVFFDGKIFAP
ncbi:MAG: hypothetical protein IJG80_04710, partial [Selenomonadaceae bacterium]|nr:hypothetical protein [Selenomonadaceae bacterium]